MDLQMHRLLEMGVLATILGAFIWSGFVWSNDMSERRIKIGRDQRSEILHAVGDLKTFCSASRNPPGK